MQASYPAHRKQRLEAQLVFISNPNERRKALIALSVLNQVIKANHWRCNGCVADCVSCTASTANPQTDIVREGVQQVRFRD